MTSLIFVKYVNLQKIKATKYCISMVTMIAGKLVPNYENVDTLIRVLKGGHHGTRVKHFSPEDWQKIYAKLKSWFGEEINCTL